LVIWLSLAQNKDKLGSRRFLEHLNTQKSGSLYVKSPSPPGSMEYYKKILLFSAKRISFYPTIQAFYQPFPSKITKSSILSCILRYRRTKFTGKILT